ncbi:MAG: carboxymuconolactone decarboxylase family protein [Candidatus Cyclobacteriaceae bacterium M3_2C_046]
MKKRFPELLDQARSWDEKALQAGPLEERTAIMVRLAGAVSIQSEVEVKNQARKALEEGLVMDELRHVIVLLGSLLGVPSMVQALCWLDDLVEQD